MIESLLGSLVGGGLRIVPEVVGFFDKKNERAHELDLQNAALELEKVRGAQKMSELTASADAAWNTGALDALREAVKGQSAPTGVRWADGLSAAIRPILTLSFFSLYAAVKIAALSHGATLVSIWGEPDNALWSSICSFWFLGRVFDKART